MPTSILYYISGHGFGHARRCAETLRVLLARHPDLHVHVRTMADCNIFKGISPNLHYEQTPIDRGAVEIDAMNIDWPATLQNVRQLIATKGTFIPREVAYLRQHQIRLIMADVPFMAGYVAEAAGIPCWAQSNFFWDWIYESVTDDQQLINTVRGGYLRCEGVLRLPLPHPTRSFKQIIETPFITSPLTLTQTQARQQLGISPAEHRPIIFVAMRGGTDPAIVREMFHVEQSYLFIASGIERQKNLIPWPAGMRFWDILQICDAVISKPGHGIITDCATMGVALLHPPRNGFREDAVTIGQGSKYFRQRQIPMADYASGNWKPHLDALLAQPKLPVATNTNGSEFISDFIAKQLGL